MARTTRPATRRASRAGSRSRRRSGFELPSLKLGAINPDVARSIVGIVLLVLGAVTLIALVLPGRGALTDWWIGSVGPWFGSVRWLLPFILLASGWYVEWGPGRHPHSGWGLTLLGAALGYAGLLGIVDIVGPFFGPYTGGRIGRFFGSVLPPLITAPGAVVLLAGISIAGLLLAFNLQLKQLLRPVTGTARWFGATAAASVRRQGEERPAPRNGSRTAGAGRSPVVAPVRGDGPAAAVATGGEIGNGSETGRLSILDEPAPRGGQAPVSQTVWTGQSDGGPSGSGAAAVARASAVVGGDEPSPLESLTAIDWQLPPIDVLEPRPASHPGPGIDHEKNKRRIEEKLLSFSIPAKVTQWNSGPVVTQYEVRPEHHVKVSRIEAVADDLAMALAARSIRIEAPIPGKDVIGIEIPNQVREMVGFRPFVEESRMLGATSPLTFALGRDVSGTAFAVDLAKMPHLLIAGATGSGKSVCVNALITSLLMRARPTEVRMILMDLKRVELAAYNGLPHLLVPVITEPERAKAALNWAVREMEERYKLLAAHGVRNIAGFNVRAGADDGEPMPYIVLIIDELADLIMREGRKVEDAVVKIAQKARAVGIHLVLATQRPSVNVVTGLIKANVPSRIAFAMSSMVDSRTVLDAPGAEDLIGRGDMLYQPVDLPRPVRMQGVFVSDREVADVTSYWLEQTGDRTFYDEGILAFADAEDAGADAGQFGWLRPLGVDEMTIPAAELVTTTQRASTSMLQTKLKLGFARASRVMDELERYGIVSPQDPRNPATPRQVYGPENWFRSQAEIDGPDVTGG